MKKNLSFVNQLTIWFITINVLVTVFHFVTAKSQRNTGQKYTNDLQDKDTLNKAILPYPITSNLIIINDSGFLYYKKQMHRIKHEENLSNEEYGNACNELGKFFFKTDKTLLAKDIFQETVRFSTKHRLPDILYKASANIGTVYKHIGNYDSALVYYKKALALLNTNGNADEEADLYKDIGLTYYNSGQVDSALYYFLHAAKRLKNNGINAKLPSIYNKIGSTYHEKGLYHKSVEYYEKSLRLVDKFKEPGLHVCILSNLGLSYYELREYNSAISIFKTVMQKADSIGDVSSKAYSMSVLAEISHSLHQHQKALKYYKEALTIYTKTKDSAKLGQTLANIGSVYKTTNQYSIALSYYNKATDLFQQNNISDKDKCFLFINIGEVLLKMDKTKDAEEYFTRAHAICLLLNNVIGLAKTNYYQSRILIKRADYKNAIKQLNKALENAMQSGDKQMLAAIFMLLSEAYQHQGKTKEDLRFYKKYVEYNNEIFKTSYQKQLAVLQTRYEVQKKEKEIELLNTKQILQKTQIRQKNRFILYLLIGLTVLSLLTFLIVIQYRRKRIAYKRLVEKNMIIDKQQEKLNLKEEEWQKMLENQNQTTEDKTLELYEEICAKIDDVMNEHKIYRNSKLTLDELAKQLDTNRTYLNGALRTLRNKNLTTIINEYRIAEARKLLIEDRHDISIEGIARTVGFNSKSTFYTAFKKITGVTPLDYVKFAGKNPDND